MANKKGNAAIVVIIVIGGLIGLLFLLNHLVFFANNFVRECSDSLECAENQYCGADFECHEYPVTYNTTVEQYYSYNFIGPAIILALALVVCAFILKKKQDKKKVSSTSYYEQQNEQPYQNH